ncbi:hypothetical protein PIB30_001645 [Stylosanthes scabra]|uniref:Replication factor A C-terminal domain-containing protein n=1 Tax=Stylosanthes scabra TaxID=79078 RepID=A0ABU6T2C7_9FABA|nr:hypothetical protein [Stylosanthes scabra]
MRELRGKILNGGFVSGGQAISQISSQPCIPIADETIPLKTIEQIIQSSEEGVCSIVAEILALDVINDDWCYQSCQKCYKNVVISGRKFYCAKCDKLYAKPYMRDGEVVEHEGKSKNECIDDGNVMQISNHAVNGGTVNSLDDGLQQGNDKGKALLTNSEECSTETLYQLTEKAILGLVDLNKEEEGADREVAGYEVNVGASHIVVGDDDEIEK